jgi:hypothetical protein
MTIEGIRKTRALTEKIGIGVTTEIIRKGERAANETVMVVTDPITMVEISATETRTPKIDPGTTGIVILNPEEIATRTENGTVEIKIAQKNAENMGVDKGADLEIETALRAKVVAVIDGASEENLTNVVKNRFFIGIPPQETETVEKMKSEAIIVTTARTARLINLRKVLKMKTFHLLSLDKN